MMQIIIHFILYALFSMMTITAAQKQTTLFQDIRTQNKKAVKKRLRNGDDCSIRNLFGNNALHSAIDEDDEEMIRILSTISYIPQTSLFYEKYKKILPDINGKNNNEDTPLCYALKTKKNNIATLLIEKKSNIHIEDSNGFTPLHHAAAYDNIIGMNILQKHGALLERRTYNGNTVAHIAAEKGHINALLYCIGHNPLFLLDRNLNNETLLIIAAKNGHTELVKLLLYEVDFINNDVEIAINIAQHNSHHAIVTFLKEQNRKRLLKCQEINTIYTTTNNLITDNCNLFKSIHHKPNNCFTYSAIKLKYYCKEKLYTMHKEQRNIIKNEYIRKYTKELCVNSIFLQMFNNINSAVCLICYKSYKPTPCITCSQSNQSFTCSLCLKQFIVCPLCQQTL